MKIAVDIHPILRSGKSGIGFYQSEMLKAMVSVNHDDEYIFNYFDITGSKREAVEKLKTDRVYPERCKWFHYKLYKMLCALLPVPYSKFFKSKPDVSIFFEYHLPPFVRGKKILVVYDTVIKDYPETVRFKTKMMLKLTLKSSIKRADRIVTISEFSKKQIMKHFGVDEKKITVIPCAADREKYYPITDSAEAIEASKIRYGISGEYFLYLGNLEPRKNIVRLISAYSKAKSEKADLPKLVLAGGKGWLYDNIFNKVNELHLENNVIFTGYVADEDVPLLMNGAEAFCFPSLYEGFGMPPLEAMSCGVPVIVSDCSSLPEVVGDCGIKVDPYSEEDIAKALIKICDEEFTAEQRKKGIERADFFSWGKSASIMRSVIGELVDKEI